MDFGIGDIFKKGNRPNPHLYLIGFLKLIGVPKLCYFFWFVIVHEQPKQILNAFADWSVFTFVFQNTNLPINKWLVLVCICPQDNRKISNQLKQTIPPGGEMKATLMDTSWNEQSNKTWVISTRSFEMYTYLHSTATILHLLLLIAATVQTNS